MRHTAPPPHLLGRVLWDFRGRNHLSIRDAAKVLGVGYVTLQSLEAGIDAKTRLPFTPREGTLRQLAARMTAEGYPVSFEELKTAADSDAAQTGGDVVKLTVAFPASERLERMLNELTRLPREQQEVFLRAAEAMLEGLSPEPSTRTNREGPGR